MLYQLVLKPCCVACNVVCNVCSSLMFFRKKEMNRYEGLVLFCLVMGIVLAIFYICCYVVVGKSKVIVHFKYNFRL